MANPQAMDDVRVRLSRRRFLQGAGALALVAAAPPVRGGVLLAAAGDPDAGTGFPLGIASFDPTPNRVILWTRRDGGSGDVRFRIAPAAGAGDVPPATLHPSDVILQGEAVPNGDGTYIAVPTGLEPGRRYWYQFLSGTSASVVGRTQTAPLTTERLRLAVTSCQDLQQGWYSVWRDIARQDLDAVLFLGDYIYEYEAYLPTERRTYPRIHVDASGAPAGETYTLADYRQRYRQYRADPDLRAAHRMHPFICVWDDHEVAGDRWATGAVNHGDNEDPAAIPYADREAAGVKAYFEYLPARESRPDPRGIHRRLRYGDLADIIMLDSRSFRSEGVGGTNRNFNPTSNIDEAGISDPDRTILGAGQKAWFKDALRDAGPRWKLIGNQLMITPLNMAVLPDAIGAVVAEQSQRPEADPLPVTYHRDGVPVNTDQWDGYQPERREVLSYLRGDEGGGPVSDVVFLTGDIHTGWSSEAYVEQGDAPLGEPVAAELVCPGISSENFNERLGMLSIGTPFPHGSTNPVGVAAIGANKHVRYVDFDSNGYVLVDVRPDRIITRQRILGLPLLNPPDYNPIEDPDATVTDAPNGAFEIRRGSSRLLPVL